MCNSVAPIVEIFKMPSPPIIPTTLRPHAVPELNPQSIEIRTDVSGIRIAAIELAMKSELGPKNRTNRGWCYATDNMIHCFRMQVATESLELRRQQHCVCMVDLPSRVAAATINSANTLMSVFDFVEFRDSRCIPVLERI